MKRADIMRSISIVGLVLIATTLVADEAKPPQLRVRPGSTYLETTDGKPFFWLGDTVWSGPAAASLNDWNAYLADRRKKGFTVVQFNAVAPWRVDKTDADGQTAFTGADPIEINEQYFARLDRYYDAIERHGLVAAPVLIWAHKKGDAGVELSEADAIRLARYQVERYGRRSVAWILAGDNRYTPDESARWQRIGRAVFADHPEAVVTTHPTGMNWPWESHGWRDEQWLSFLGYQSGHGDDARTLAWIHSGPPRQGAKVAPPRPIINLEPPYEDHFAYQSKQPHPAYHVRRAAYWSLLSGPPSGLTYGAHGVWSWQTKAGIPADHPGSGTARPWREALQLPGAAQMGLLAGLLRSLDWWRLRPAQKLLVEQPGANDPSKFVAVARTDDGETLLAYLPIGGKIALDPKNLSTAAKYEWFDPRTGARRPAPADATGTFAAPDANDWVLIGVE